MRDAENQASAVIPAEERIRILDLLRDNTGFDDPEAWVDYAHGHSFQPVDAVRIDRCPSCAAEPKSGRTLGQYVHYSTLICLLECDRCRLIWADAALDPAVVRQHFEGAYKDEEYFREQRKAIFVHLAGLIDGLAGDGARVLDIGGARGDLMHRVAGSRPDLRVTVQDISASATSWAADRFGFETICGDVGALEVEDSPLDVVVLSDVLYYESHLTRLWSVLQRRVSEGGSVVIRVPNKLAWIRAGQRLTNVTRSASQRRRQDQLRFFNPEHIYILTRRYLVDRLRELGFAEIRTIPSPLLGAASPVGPRSIYFELARAVNALTKGRWVITPSQLVVGTHRSRNGG